MPEAANTTPAETISMLPYRIRVNGSTVAAFDNPHAAAAHLVTLVGPDKPAAGLVWSSDPI
ncbi:hypothetical protein [Agromyces humi]|uniref:hypothetical protein n=1 Tax=Agromyces humi TaxID=1766800 RepID=UPI001359C16A|nr:hypothetical protein [Agromyces humi]